MTDLIEVDDALVGGKHSGKRGRGAGGKTSVLIGCENQGKKAGFFAMKAVDKETARGTIRLSLGRFTTENDVDKAVEAISRACQDDLKKPGRRFRQPGVKNEIRGLQCCCSSHRFQE